MELLKKVATDSRLSAYSKTIFAYLYSISNENMIKFKKCESLSAELKINPQTFTKSVKQLENCGYISVFRSPFCTNVYVLKPKTTGYPNWRKPAKVNWRDKLKSEVMR